MADEIPEGSFVDAAGRETFDAFVVIRGAGVFAESHGVAECDSLTGSEAGVDGGKRSEQRQAPAAVGSESQRHSSLHSGAYADVQFFAERAAGAGEVLHGDLFAERSIY